MSRTFTSESVSPPGRPPRCSRWNTGCWRNLGRSTHAPPTARRDTLKRMTTTSARAAPARRPVHRLVRPARRGRPCLLHFRRDRDLRPAAVRHRPRGLRHGRRRDRLRSVRGLRAAAATVGRPAQSDTWAPPTAHQGRAALRRQSVLTAARGRLPRSSHSGWCSASPRRPSSWRRSPRSPTSRRLAAWARR